jgi:hypothetical protein
MLTSHDQGIKLYDQSLIFHDHPPGHQIALVMTNSIGHDHPGRIIHKTLFFFKFFFILLFFFRKNFFFQKSAEHVF